jgi:signal transduction histidine kinase
MRLTLKLTLGILVGVALTLIVNGFFAAARDRALLVDNLKKDHLVLGRALLVDVAEEQRDHGDDGAFRLVQRMNDERPGIDIVAVHPDALPADFATHLASAGSVQVVDVASAGERAVTWLPLVVHGQLVLALSLAEPLAPIDAHVEAAVVRRGIVAVVGLGASAIIAWLFGLFVVGRPVRALVDKARRVGGGDLTGPLSLPATRRDELGDLGAELNAMCERLAAARAELVRADRLSTLGLLAAGLAHELGTPLNVVAGRARLIADGDVAGDVKRGAAMIEEQAQRMTRIVRQLLDFARARPPHKERIDVAELSKETAEMVNALSEKKGVAVVVDAPAPAPAEVDRDQLRQVVTNLLVNAVHASDPGHNVRVDVRAQKDGVRIAVIDEGIGMNEETMKHCFTPFFTTKDVGEGTGLGLAVAWGLVEENGGHISVASAPGKGSTFTIELPGIELLGASA